MTPPVILLTFAQDRSVPARSLRALAAEQNGITEALRNAEKAGRCKVVTLVDVTLESLNRNLGLYNEDIVGFHFAGHAGPGSVQVVASDGMPQDALGPGIAQRLGLLRRLRFVFLNGCWTAPQRTMLVKHCEQAAVITTERAVLDEAAQVFAVLFYQSLAATTEGGASVGEAFARAETRVRQSWPSPADVRRDAVPSDGDGEAAASDGDGDRMARPAGRTSAAPDLPWRIDGPESARAWCLPPPPGGAGPAEVSTHRLPHCGPHFVGRDADLAWLTAAWRDPAVTIASLIAWGGEGKSTIARYWLDALQARGWDGAARVYAWSFHSRGAGEDRQESADLFIDQMLRWLGDPTPEQGDPSEKGERLAGLIKRQRTLLILDGVEPLQHPPGQWPGAFKDLALRVLLECLADGMDGLCLVTSRLDLTDLNDRPHAVRSRPVERLSTEAGVEFLAALRVKGEPEELAAAVEEYAGHALALRLLGGYLATVEGGDIRRRGVIGGLTTAEDGGAHARRVMAAYERWLPPADVAVLRLVGLFDRAAEPAAVEALRASPVIEGLTDAIAGLGHREWQTAVSHLRDLGLLAREVGDTLDAHPLVREHFAGRLRTEAPAAWQTGHERLYRHFEAAAAEDQPATLAGLEPLFRAVLHGCAAGRYEEVLGEVYWRRIRRESVFYTTRKLGAFAADLAALAAFFEVPWQRPQRALSADNQAWVLGAAGFALRALGRLAEAEAPLAAGLAFVVKQTDWWNAAAGTSTLAELLLILGRLGGAPAAPGAIERAREAVAHADRSGDGFRRMGMRTILADALHQRGRTAEARTLFVEAERLQAEQQPELPLLYSVQGYRYGDLLLTLGEPAEARRRAEKTMVWSRQSGLGLLTIALDHLLLGRAALATAPDPEHPDFALARHHLDAAVTGLRKAGQMHEQPRGLLARAALHRLAADWPAARRDLAEAHRIATRGGMRLFLADHHLESARLHLAIGDLPAARAAYTAARAEVEAIGYHRRLPELDVLATKLAAS